jgi:hypothetical protein
MPEVSRETDERERVADELRRIRENARETASQDPRTLPPPAPVAEPEVLSELRPPRGPEPPQRPDTGGVQALWPARAQREPRGLRGALARLLRRLLGPTLDAQADFNARQARLDTELADYVDARADATHRHYDHVLGLYGRRMDEIDERHVQLSRELVTHVHDLVKRIDLVLSEAERGRLSLESALRDLRARLVRLEERLPRE